MNKIPWALLTSTIAALLGLTLLIAPLSAQDTSHVEVSGGYQFAKFSDGISQKRLNSHGWDAAVAFYFNRWLRIKADFSGAYGTDDTSSALPFAPPITPTPLGPSFRHGTVAASPLSESFCWAATKKISPGTPPPQRASPYWPGEVLMCNLILICHYAQPMWIGSIPVPPTPPYGLRGTTYGS